MEALFGKTIHLLSTMLDFRSARHQVISSNIANLDTPSYQPRDLDFQAELYEAMNRGQKVGLTQTHPAHLPLHKGSEAFYRAVTTGDQVSIDREMMNLTENQLQQNLAVDFLARKFRSLTNVLAEGR
jgi:flagellar basal-body rod protein FlgB